eukprot:351144-Chlamydomonas_euryale.AAC.1
MPFSLLHSTAMMHMAPLALMVHTCIMTHMAPLALQGQQICVMCVTCNRGLSRVSGRTLLCLALAKARSIKTGGNRHSGGQQDTKAPASIRANLLDGIPKGELNQERIPKGALNQERIPKGRVESGEDS